MSERIGDTSSIESVLHEERVFEPPGGFSESIGGAYISSMQQYREMYARSIKDPEGFWAEFAQELDWFEKWTKVLQWKEPDAKWFLGGKTNICHNCVDRQVNNGFGDQVAIIWEGEPTSAPQAFPQQAERPQAFPEIRRLTYNDLLREVSRFANVLKKLGVRKGDVVTLYMGMVPQLAIAMLACARIGAVHSVIFGGFSSQAIVDRVQDAKSRVIVTADGGWRRGKIVPLKANVDAAAGMTGLIETVIVLKRCGNDIAWTKGRDHWWHELTAVASDDCPCEAMDSEDMLFLLYTSGSTGKPKGIVHTTGGYMVYTYLTSKYVFNLVPDRGQVYWCTADIGWVTGHSYIVYGILPTRVPSFMYEGAPNFPAEDRFWDIVERHRITQFYTAPTAIRAFMKWGDEHPRKHDLSSLKLLGTVGEPINPEAWMWYRRVIGSERCPIVDTWWQTETGGQLIMPMPGATPAVPGSCTLPFFGIDAAVVNEQGEEQPANVGGLLVIRTPWPGMLRGIFGDRQRFIDTYFSRIPGAYLTGDGARRDERGYFWIMGRVDDVINVAGHRLGTMEIESALVSHPAVVEAAVVGMPHEIKGTAIAAFVTLDQGHSPSPALRDELFHHVGKEIGAIARPDLIRFTDALPKTRSGKIMRRLLRDIAAGTDTKQDTTTLEDISVLARLRESEEG
ncbi:MAG: acetate--CoA ligase [Planctomycetota bacterium]|nr:acetate--CoA ligase [Planctomycetota bacterium]MCZ6810596.1 acetate--CoA ligase [Planctomycetota bacterium]